MSEISGTLLFSAVSPSTRQGVEMGLAGGSAFIVGAGALERRHRIRKVVKNRDWESPRLPWACMRPKPPCPNSSLQAHLHGLREMLQGGYHLHARSYVWAQGCRSCAHHPADPAQLLAPELGAKPIS